MTTARDIIRLVLRSIDFELELLESSLEYAEIKKREKKEGKLQAMISGANHLVAADEFDYSIGFHSGLACECRDRIDSLKRRREYYESLDKTCADEEAQEAVQEDEENE